MDDTHLQKQKTIEKIFRTHLVKEFIKNNAKYWDDTFDDLEMMIIEALLKLNDDKFEKLQQDRMQPSGISRGLECFISRMISNQLNSQTSEYYRLHRRWKNNRSELKKGWDE